MKRQKVAEEAYSILKKPYIILSHISTHYCSTQSLVDSRQLSILAYCCSTVSIKDTGEIPCGTPARCTDAETSRRRSHQDECCSDVWHSTARHRCLHRWLYFPWEVSQRPGAVSYTGLGTGFSEASSETNAAKDAVGQVDCLGCCGSLRRGWLCVAKVIIMRPRRRGEVAGYPCFINVLRQRGHL